ncbi:putative major facilitator superfamily transporter [Xylariomycetidae sp. FL2044]|nr:putative major facilitator superfamily transporter [Xylariomycetidae sp. FL2044]
MSEKLPQVPAPSVQPLLLDQQQQQQQQQQLQQQQHGVPLVADHATSKSAYSEFSAPARRTIVIICAFAGFFSPFSAFTYFPALAYMSEDLGVSLQLMELTITMFLVVQGVVPSLLGDLADQIGRRPVYIAALTLYFVACVGLAVQKSYPVLMVLRMLQSAGSSGTIALGIMVVSDLTPPHSRGRYVGALLSGPNCGPSLGPVVGGILAQLAHWSWIFWLLAILAGLCLLPIILVFPETCRYVVGNGAFLGGPFNQPPISVLCPKDRSRPGPDTELTYRLRKFPNPFLCLRLLATRHDSLLLTSNALFYISYSCLHASLAPLVMQYYGLNALEAGLCYLAYGIATTSSSYVIGKVLDFDYRMTAKEARITINTTKGDDMATFPIERARVRSSMYCVVSGILAPIGFGWAVQAQVHLSCPLAMTFICGVAFTGVFNTCQTLNVDLHPDETGLASVAASITRCLAAAVGVAALQPMLTAVGVGWTFTFFGALSGILVPMLLALRYWGPAWRNCRWESS